MPVTVIDTIQPNNAGAFPVVRDIDVQGGIQVQSSTAARDAISLNNQKIGMIVYVTANSTYYQLTVTGTPGTWVAANLGSTTALSGDVTGTNGANTVTKIRGTVVSTNSVANDGFALVSTGGQYVPAGVSPVFNVKNFGAKGNGVHDDTAAFVAAVAAKEAAGQGVIYIPAGYYKTTATIDFGAKSCLIKGDGWGFHGLGDFALNPSNCHGSIITSSMTSGHSFTVGENDIGIVQVGIKFQDLAFVNTNWTTASPSGVNNTALGLFIRPSNLVTSTNVEIDNVYIAGFGVGFDPGATEEGSFKDLVLWSNTIGLQGSLGSTNCSFYNLQCNANTYGMKLLVSGQWQFFGGLVQSNFYKGIWFQANNTLLEHSFRGMWFENNNSFHESDGYGGDIIYDLTLETSANISIIAQNSFLQCHFGGGADGYARPVQFVRNATNRNSSTYTQIKFDGCYALGETLAIQGSAGANSILSSVIDCEFNGSFTDAGYYTSVINSRFSGTPTDTRLGTAINAITENAPFLIKTGLNQGLSLDNSGTGSAVLSTSGIINLPNNTGIYQRAGTHAVDLNMIRIDSSDNMTVGSGNLASMTLNFGTGPLQATGTQGISLTAGSGFQVSMLTADGGGLQAFNFANKSLTPQLYFARGSGNININAETLNTDSIPPTLTISAGSAYTSSSINNNGADLILAPGAAHGGTNGYLNINNANTATSASAGSNGDVPGQVVGYLEIKIGGSVVKIPYYAV